MLLKLDEPKLLAEPIAIISELVSEVKARISKEGIEINALDPANVALASLKIPASVFSQFEVKEEILGLNIEDLKQVLRRTTANSSLIIKKDDNENMLHLEIQDKNKKSSKRSFSLALLAAEEDERKKQDLSFATEVVLNSGLFSEAITDASVVSDACSFITTKELFAIEAKGSLHKSRTEFSENDAKLNAVNAGAKYSLEYLQKFVKGEKISNSVTIKFSTDYPLKLDFKDKIELSFVLAPRVEEE